jgi:hypothetical protein
MVYPRSTLTRPAPTDKSTTTPSLTGTDDASTISGVSALTETTGLTGATGLQSKLALLRAGEMVVNETPDSHLLSLVPYNRKLKDIIGNTQPPSTDSGNVLCLSYHVKGGCFSNCRRKNTHGITLSMAEKGRLENYLADRLEKLGK